MVNPFQVKEEGLEERGEPLAQVLVAVLGLEVEALLGSQKIQEGGVVWVKAQELILEVVQVLVKA